MSADFAQTEQKLWSLQAASSSTTNENNNITKYNPGTPRFKLAHSGSGKVNY